MAEREERYLLGGEVQGDDAYLGGELSGGTPGRGSQIKVPFLAAVSVDADGHPVHAKLTPVSGFTRKAVAAWASAHLTPDSVVVSDGLSCFSGVGDAGCVHQPVVVGNRKPRDLPDFLWVNTVLGLRQDRSRRGLPRLRVRQVRRALPRRHCLPIQQALQAGHDYATPARQTRRPSGRVLRTGCAKLGLLANQDSECRIDSNSQSWAVLSGAADAERARMAMQALDERLVRREHGLIQLLDPPFDRSDLDPGYIKGYVPGVRENGGQYTHGAIWAAMAFAALGDSRRAWELTTMINPANHAKTPEAVATYKVEPYVMAADVYAVAPHIGRGGWTWYTGSAGWMYRLILESLLGLRLAVDRLTVAPCLPAHWQGLKIHYRYRETVYHIAIAQTFTAGDVMGGVTGLRVDGVDQEGHAIVLVDDRREHAVQVTVSGRRAGGQR